MTAENSEEQKLKEASENLSPMKSTAKDAVIRGQQHQDLFKQAEKGRTNASNGSLGQYQKAAADAPIDWAEQNQSIEIFSDDVTVSRFNNGKERQFTRSKSPTEDHEKPIEIAQKLPDFQLKLDLDQTTRDNLSCFIFRGKEDEQMDYNACEAAYKAFPEFSRHPQVDKELAAAIIRNELHFYSLWKDATADSIASALGGIPGRPETSLGAGQIQQRHLARLLKEFPVLNDRADITNPVKAVLDKHKVPWLVTAYLADGIRTMEKSKQQVTNQSLILYYNPGGREHIKNVINQLMWIKKHHHQS